MGLSKYHHTIYRSITFRSPQADTITQLNSSSWGNILKQLETSLKRLFMVLPLSVKTPPPRVLGVWEEKQDINRTH